MYIRPLNVNSSVVFMNKAFYAEKIIYFNGNVPAHVCSDICVKLLYTAQGKSKYTCKFYVFSKSHESQNWIQKIQQSSLIVISCYNL